MALAFWVVGSLIHPLLIGPTPIIMLIIAALALLAREVGWLAFALPENKRLVPETVFRLGSFTGPLQFGIEMGTGIRTYLPTALAHLSAVAILLVPSASAATAAGLGFALGRCIMVVLAARSVDVQAWEHAWKRNQYLIRPALTAVATCAVAAIILVTLRT